MEYHGPIRTVGVAEILDETSFSYKVRLAVSGKEVWIHRSFIIDSVPKAFVVPEWFYKKELAQYEQLSPTDEIPF